MKSQPCTAHEWLQATPVKENTLVCARCNTKTPIGKWDVPRCIKHYVSPDAVWKKE